MNQANLTSAIEKYYDRVFTKYYNPNHKIFTTHQYMRVEGMGERAIKFHIELLLTQGKKVKAGYTGTKIQGIHRRYIFY